MARRALVVPDVGGDPIASDVAPALCSCPHDLDATHRSVAQDGGDAADVLPERLSGLGVDRTIDSEEEQSRFPRRLILRWGGTAFELSPEVRTPHGAHRRGHGASTVPTTTARYSPYGPASALGPGFELVDTRRETHECGHRAERPAGRPTVVDVPADAVVLEINGREMRVTHPDKVFFPTEGGTKLDLVRYYLDNGEAVMRQMQDRPVLLQRFPDGAAGSSFFQKRIPDSAPPWLTTAVVTTPNGTTSNALVIVDLAHLVWAVNLGCIGFHSWPVRADDIEHPDELRIDLDPQPGTTYAMARETAALVKTLFDDLGLVGFVKTTGSRGLHVYVRLRREWDAVAVRSAAVAVARELERRRPDLVTAAWWKEERGQRIFVDFNQNAPHKTVFAPWSVRARDPALVSCPLSWDDVDQVVPADLTMATVPDRVARLGDPWATIDDVPQSLEPLLDLVRGDQSAGLADAPWPPVYPKMAGEPPRVAPSRARKPR